MHRLLEVGEGGLMLAHCFLLQCKMEVPPRVFGREAQCLFKLRDTVRRCIQVQLRKRKLKVRQCVVRWMGSRCNYEAGCAFAVPGACGAARQQH